MNTTQLAGVTFGVGMALIGLLVVGGVVVDGVTSSGDYMLVLVGLGLVWVGGTISEKVNP